jgi:hypothetical protein
MVQYLLVTFTFEVVSLIVRGLITIIQEKKLILCQKDRRMMR